tara:strand:- start:1864 stop:1989 length:126 start_codon:yes stop_codon:yes gene_type:complete
MIEDSAEELGFDELDGWEYASPAEISKLKGFERSKEWVVQL